MSENNGKSSLNSLSEPIQYLPDDAYIMAFDFINYRLKRSNLMWLDCPDLPENPSSAVLAMRNLGTKFEKDYQEKLTEESRICKITDETSVIDFLNIALALFKEERNKNEDIEITWGRIVSFFAFSGLLAVQCYRSGHRSLIHSLAQWVAIFVEWKLQPWIDSNGGWNSLTKFENKIKNNEAAMRSKRMTALVVMTSASIAILGLIIFARKS